MTDSLPITVGVDGSAPSLAAVDYAVSMAKGRQAPLLLVHAYQGPLYGYPMYTYAGEPAEADLRRQAEHTLQQLVDRLRTENPDLTVRGVQAEGGPASVLIERSGRAAVTVLGSRGHGGFTGMLLGSVSTQVAGHGRGPIVVLHGEPGDRPFDGPIVVGHDGSEGAEPALLFAADEASSRGSTLEVLSFHWPGLDDDRAKAEETLAQATQRLAISHPDVKVEAHTAPGMDPAFRLITRSRTAALTVVGSRGLGGFSGMLLGSVGRTLLHHAFGPIAVVHPSTAH